MAVFVDTEIMANFKLSGIGITNIAGKIGGQVFQRNKYGFFVKNNTIPPFRNNAFNTPQRTKFANLVKGWRTLTGAEQLTWNTNTLNFPRTNKFGDTIYLDGFNFYASSNLNLNTIGLPSATTAPASPAAQPTFDFSLENAGLTSDVFVNLQDLSSQLSSISWYYVVEMSGLLSGGQVNNKNKCRFMFYVAPSFDAVLTDAVLSIPPDQPLTFESHDHTRNGSVGKGEVVGPNYLLYFTNPSDTITGGFNYDYFLNGNFDSGGSTLLVSHPQVQVGGLYSLKTALSQRPVTRYQSLKKRFGQVLTAGAQVQVKVSMINMITGEQTAPIYKIFTAS